MIKVLIADDHERVRHGLKQLIRECMGRVQIGEATHGEEVLKLVQQDHWDVLLLDISILIRPSAEVLQTIQTVKPNLPILMLSLYSEIEFGFHKLKTGKMGFVNKASAVEKIIPAIQEALFNSK